jgi:hypothetical protein
MQKHERLDPPPDPRKPDRRDTQAKWLLLIICLLLGLIVSQVAQRFL